MIRLVAVIGVCAWLSQTPARPGSALVPGLRLVYVSGADTQPKWTIDSVTWELSYEGRSGCSRIVIRGGPAAGARLLCRSGDTLLSWSPRTSRWAPQRPLAPGVTVAVPRTGGGQTTFDVEATTCDQVGDARIAPVATVVLTTDSSGRAVRRLRERYAPSLTTATAGVLEVRDGEAWLGIRGSLIPNPNPEPRARVPSLTRGASRCSCARRRSAGPSARGRE